MNKLIYILSAFLLMLTSCTMPKDFKWTKKTSSKSKEIGLSKVEVIILSSIVEKETKMADEKPKIARVYLNRLKKGMYLQSDPTVIFALGDTTIKRILKSHLEIDSPYNTYKNKGLPPAPICKPTKETIIAVINAEKNNYLYFCATPDFSGHFNYAETIGEHMEYIEQYIEAHNKKTH